MKDILSRIQHTRNIKSPKEELNALLAIMPLLEQAYHDTDTPIVSDEIYDDLKRRKETLEAMLGVVEQRNVGGSKGRVKHSTRLLSLKDIFDKTELTKWLQSVYKALGDVFTFTAELKYDGLAICLWYDDGKLTHAITRGDGEYGEDVTQRFLQLCPGWATYSDKKVTEIRGEGVVLTESFLRYNALLKEQDKEPYSTERNLAAGMLRGSGEWLQGFTFIPYTAYPQVSGVFTDTLISLESQSPDPRKLMLGLFQGGEGISTTLDKFIDDLIIERDNQPCLVDGLVFKVNKIEHQLKLGENNAYPKWAVAFKFPPRGQWSVLRDVTWQVGKSRVLTPVASIDPVKVGGVVIDSPTLHNYPEIQRLGLSIGCKVYVERRGDVIPKITYAEPTDPKAPVVEPPERCPCCDERVEIEDVYIRCSNFRCSASVVASILHAVGRSGFDIDGLGEVTITQLVSEGILTHPLDLYTLTLDKITEYTNMGDLNARKVIEQLYKSGPVRLSNLIYALGLKGIGKVGAKKLALEVGTLANLTEHEVIPDFLREMLNDIIKRKKPAVQDAIEVLSPSLTKTACITGSFQSHRDEVVAELNKLGYKVVGDVTTKTDILVVGSNPTQRKVDKARQLGKIIFTVIGESGTTDTLSSVIKEFLTSSE